MGDLTDPDSKENCKKIFWNKTEQSKYFQKYPEIVNFVKYVTSIV